MTVLIAILFLFFNQLFWESVALGYLFVNCIDAFLNIKYWMVKSFSPFYWRGGRLVVLVNISWTHSRLIHVLPRTHNFVLFIFFKFQRRWHFIYTIQTYYKSSVYSPSLKLFQPTSLRNTGLIDPYLFIYFIPGLKLCTPRPNSDIYAKTMVKWKNNYGSSSH